ncbi:DUF1761 domain-containing protein [uncultured Psychroserpens sp.]|uniref:DUF1761 domain-containing protein n=1 Tax=uncultured Psychroserpens sp. TaxID=255436 RepID=UPI00262EF4EC|nr:DUF1761 domain-containing protein [uncultured Psychroserpens sp.]
MEDIFINHWAVFVCALISILLGGIWYSPLLFYRAWIKEIKITNEEMKNTKFLKVRIIGILLSYFMSYNIAFLLGSSSTNWQWGLMIGFLCGFGLIWPRLIIISLNEKKTWNYILIHGGYTVIYFSIVGLILGAWR